MRSGGFVNCYSAFSSCSILIHSFPWYFNYVTPLWSAANYYQQLSVRWKAWNIPKKCMHLTGTKEATTIDRCEVYSITSHTFGKQWIITNGVQWDKGHKVTKWSEVNQSYLARWCWKKDLFCSQWGAVDLSINIHFLPIVWSQYIHSAQILQLHNTPLVSN